jgi:hypothetical protein
MQEMRAETLSLYAGNSTAAGLQTKTYMRIAILLCALLVVSTLCMAQSEKESLAVIELHKKKFSWLVNRNYDSLQSLLDDNVLYIHSNGLTETKADVFKNLKEEIISYTKSDVLELQVRIFGNSAVVTGKGVFAGKARGNAFELNLAYTEVYVKSAGKWKLVSRHACKV